MLKIKENAQLLAKKKKCPTQLNYLLAKKQNQNLHTIFERKKKIHCRQLGVRKNRAWELEIAEIAKDGSLKFAEFIFYGLIHSKY